MGKEKNYKDGKEIGDVRKRELKVDRKNWGISHWQNVRKRPEEIGDKRETSHYSETSLSSCLRRCWWRCLCHHVWGYAGGDVFIMSEEMLVEMSLSSHLRICWRRCLCHHVWGDAGLDKLVLPVISLLGSVGWTHLLLTWWENWRATFFA